MYIFNGYGLLVDASYIESVTGTPQSAWQLE